MPDSPLLQTLADLVAINSVNPEWNGPGEADVAVYVTNFFEQRGIAVERQEVLPGRDNLLIRLPGRDRSCTVLLEAHMDTVSTDNMSIEPFTPRIENGRMWGRGSCDVKAGLACMMQAVADLKESNEVPPMDVLLAAVVDEEYIYRGVRALVKSFDTKPVAAIVAEPTELRVMRANKGVLRWQIITHGKAAHSAKPHLGADAITAMADVVRAFADDAPYLKQLSHPLVGSPSLNIGTIQGGDQVNFVPDRCTIEIDRRLIPGEAIDDVVERYDRLLDPVRERHPKIRVEMVKPYTQDAAMDTPEEESVVQSASAALKAMNMPPEPAGVPFGCDCTKISRAGVPAIIFGPGCIDQAHTADEFIEVRQVELAHEFYRHFLLRFVNK
ncbi:MAG: M20 family metallopeptidase [Limisphaerales bacterium]